MTTEESRESLDRAEQEPAMRAATRFIEAGGRGMTDETSGTTTQAETSEEEAERLREALKLATAIVVVAGVEVSAHVADWRALTDTAAAE